jgi:disulfide bond formation protein DsbB
MRRFLAILAIGVDLVVIFALVLLVASQFSAAAADLRRRIEVSLYGYELWLAFAVALTATVGSLYLSEIAHLQPCRFCWYQRIAMYPSALILGIAAWKNDRAVRRYVFPLATIGAIIAAYHYLIENFPSLSFSDTCDPQVPCTAAVIWEFDFVSVPFMALATFALIIVLLAVARSNDHTPVEYDMSETDPP